AAEGGARGAASSIADVVSRLREDPRLGSARVMRPHPLLASVARQGRFVVIAPALVLERGRDALRPFAGHFADGAAILILLDHPRRPRGGGVEAALTRGLGAILREDADEDELYVAIHNAFELMEARARAAAPRRAALADSEEMGLLLSIARAISTERDVDRLLHLILEKSRFITGADAGSIYVVEGDDPDMMGRMLRFKLSQNESVRFDSREFTFPVGPGSMAGFVALHCRPLNIPDVYDLSADAELRFDRSFDERVGYRTKSMLCAPLLSRAGDVIGVIQLINKKRDPERRLLDQGDVHDHVIPFDAHSEDLLTMLASQAGILLENAQLYAEIQQMLEGFVRASVEAIEQRDPTTSGHSQRVAEFTVGLAKAVEHVDTGPYREVTWTREDLKELEYASLLHDFGKIGVREEVLLKAKKLFPYELDKIRARFDFAVRSVELDILSRKLAAIERGAPQDQIAALDEELATHKAQLLAGFAAICAANEPSILNSGNFERIEVIAHETFTDMEGQVLPLLRPEELESLKIARGSLTPSEMLEIQRHVTHTFEFLKQVPWGKQFRRVAHIAASHHERLNGAGYPRGLRAEEIPLQSKMMTISDIFDALTAKDRPYKRAVPVQKALDILGLEVKDGHIDADLVKIFIEAKVWQEVIEPEAAR
ncbi:MAG TPA: HD domain-containing phosphohydrolase, partial [Candidatus Nanopelagicales bacterium]|nr:HD domain-containing phosphohydrolase [Candidatus Nanopelagicales bacterium]